MSINNIRLERHSYVNNRGQVTLFMLYYFGREKFRKKLGKVDIEDLDIYEQKINKPEKNIGIISMYKSVRKKFIEAYLAMDDADCRPTVPNFKRFYNAREKEIVIDTRPVVADFKEWAYKAQGVSNKRLRKAVLSVLNNYDKHLTYPKINEQFVEDFSISMMEGRTTNLNKKATNQTVKTYLAVIRKFLKDTERLGYHKSEFHKYMMEVFSDLYKVVKKRRSPLESSELTVLRTYAMELPKGKIQKNLDAFLLECCLGLRNSDIIGLKEMDIISREGRKYVKKHMKKTTKESQLLYIGEFAQEILDRNPGLFKSVNNKSVIATIRKICKEVGIDREVKRSYTVGKRLVEEVDPFYKVIDTHTARYTYASLYYASTKDIIGMKNQLGHSNIETTMRYHNSNEISHFEVLG